MSKKEILNVEELILKFKKVHGNNFDYSKVVYESFTQKVIITCPDHGDFFQQPRLHLRGSNGCKISIKLRKKNNF